MLDLKRAFNSYDDEYLEFSRIPLKDRLHERHDLCGLLLLARLVPAAKDNVIGEDAISYTGHDQVYFTFDTDVFAENASEDDVIYLLRCGIMYDSHQDSFYRFT